MRGSCSEQQKKDLAVYEFNAEDLAVEDASDKYRKRSSGLYPSSKPKSNPKDENGESLKYMFLQSCTPSADFTQQP